MDILSLGEKIKKLRKEKNLTLKELAGDRITAAQISHIERDKSHTSQELLDYLSKKLDVSVEYLLETKDMQAKKLTDNLIMQSEIYINCGDLNRVKQDINKIMDICKEYKLVENYGKSNFLLAKLNLKQHDYNSAVVNFEKSLYFFIKNNDRENIIKCYMNIGKIYIKEQFYKGALSHFEFAQDVLKEHDIQDVNLIKELYSNISYCYSKLNQNEKSLEYVEKIREIEGIVDIKEETDILVLRANNLLNAGRYEEAKECFKSALLIIDKESSKTELANIYLTICEVYSNLDDIESLLEYAQKAYSLKITDEDDIMVDSLFQIIQGYIKIKDYETARKYTKIALVASIKIKSKMLEYKSLKLYSCIYEKEEKYDMAIEYLNKCIDIITGIDDKKILADLYIELGQLYTNTSKEKELEYYQKGVNIYKTLDII